MYQKKALTTNYCLLFHIIYVCTNKSSFVQHFFYLVWNTTYKNKVFCLFNYLINWLVFKRKHCGTPKSQLPIQEVVESKSQQVCNYKMCGQTQKEKEWTCLFAMAYETASTSAILLLNQCASAMHAQANTFCYYLGNKVNRSPSLVSFFSSISMHIEMLMWHFMVAVYK